MNNMPILTLQTLLTLAFANLLARQPSENSLQYMATSYLL